MTINISATIINAAICKSLLWKMSSKGETIKVLAHLVVFQIVKHFLST